MAKNQADATAALAAQAGGAGAVQSESTGPEAGNGSEPTGGVTSTDGATAFGPADTDGPAVTDPKPVVRKLVRARVLVDGRFGCVNDVVQVDGDTLAAAGGELCGNPASVAYALSLK